MIDLDAKHIKFIKSIFDSYLKEYKLYLFGSRAKGTAKKYSDVDLAVKSDDLTAEIKSKLEFVFLNSTFPYEVDIIDLNNVTPEFAAIITSSLVEI